MSLDLILGSERGSGVKFMFICSEWASFCDLPDDLGFMLECPGGWTGQISWKHIYGYGDWAPSMGLLGIEEISCTIGETSEGPERGLVEGVKAFSGCSQ